MRKKLHWILLISLLFSVMVDAKTQKHVRKKTPARTSAKRTQKTSSPKLSKPKLQEKKNTPLIVVPSPAPATTTVPAASAAPSLPPTEAPPAAPIENLETTEITTPPLLSSEDPFPRPKELEPNVRFWMRVYSEWRTDQIVLSDRDDLRLVYHVIQLPNTYDAMDRGIYEKTVRETKEQVANALDELNQLQPSSDKNLNGMQREIYLSLESIPDKNKYAHSDNIRSQVGQRDRFEKGYINSANYDMEMRKRLARRGVPEELIALVFVESMFYAPAHSKAGAKGLWQFIYTTGKYHMYINPLVDERLDPVIATEAAIDYLKKAKENLKEWPLAITAYNYGPAGIARAVQEVGSYNIVDIINNYQARRFGFASKNYYAEFLAALEVYKNADKYFSAVKRPFHWDYNTVKLPCSAYIRDLVAANAINRDWLFTHNPALTDKVQNGQEIIPQGYSLRIPKGQAAQFTKSLAAAYKAQRIRADSHIRAKHRANGRQTVQQIASLYNILVNNLSERLGYSPQEKPKKGTVIVVRSADTPYTEIPPALYTPTQTASKVERASPQGKLDS